MFTTLWASMACYRDSFFFCHLLSLIHMGIVYRSQVPEASKLEAITSARHLFSCFYIVSVNLHCETEDATNTNPSRHNANYRIIAS
jgi:hypothetical protein